MKILFIIIGTAVLFVSAAWLFVDCCIQFMIQQEDKQLQERINEERLLGLDDDPAGYRDTV